MANCPATAWMAVGPATFFHVLRDGTRRNHGCGLGSEITMCVQARESCAERTFAMMMATGNVRNESMLDTKFTMNTLTKKMEMPRKRARKPPFDCKYLMVLRKLEVMGCCSTRRTSGSVVLLMGACGSSVGRGSNTMASGDSTIRRAGITRPKVYSTYCERVSIRTFGSASGGIYHQRDNEEEDNGNAEENGTPCWNLILLLRVFLHMGCAHLESSAGERAY